MKHKMTRFIFSFIFLLMSVFAFGQDSEALRNQAMQSFNEGKFAEALSALEEIKDRETLENTNVNLWKEHISDIQKIKFRKNEPIINTLSIVSIETGLLSHYGLYDSDTKQFLVPPVYDKIDFLNYNAPKNLIQIHKGKKRGLCNLKGDFVIPLGYYTISAIERLKLLTTKEYNGIEPSSSLKSSIYDWSGKLLLNNYEYADSHGNFIVLKTLDNLFGLYDIENSRMVLENFTAIKIAPENYSSKEDFLFVSKGNQSFFYYPKTNILQPNNDFDDFIRPVRDLYPLLDLIAAKSNPKEDLGDDDYILVKSNHKTGIYNLQEKKYFAFPVYDSIAPNGNCLIGAKWSNLFFDGPVEKIIIQNQYGSRVNNMQPIFSKNGKYGLKDIKGGVILNAEYDEINSSLQLRKGNLWGFLGYNNTLVKPQFDYIYQNGGQVETYLGEKWQTYIYDPRKKQYHAYKKPKKSISDPVEYLDFDENNYYGLKAERKKIRKGDLYGLADLNDKEIVKPSYNSISLTRLNTFIVSDAKDNKGLVDESGKIIIPILYTDIEPFGKDNYLVKKANLTGVFNKAGIEIFPIKYLSVKPIYDDLFIVEKEVSLYGIVDKNDRIIYPFTINAFLADETIFKTASNDIYIFCLEIKNAGKSLIKIKNGVASKPFEGYEVYDSNGGFMWLRKGGLIGYYNFKNNGLTEPEFKEILYIRETDTYLLKKDDYFEYKLDSLKSITKTVKPIISYQKGFFIYKEKTGMGLIGPKGELSKTLYPKLEFLNYNPSKKPLFKYYSNEKSEKNGLIDFDGNILVKADKYDDINYLMEANQSFPVKKFASDDLKLIFVCTDKSNLIFNKTDFLSSSGKKIANIKIQKEYSTVFSGNFNNSLILYKSDRFIKIFDLKTNKIILNEKSDRVGSEMQSTFTNYYYMDPKSDGKKGIAQLINANGAIIAERPFAYISNPNHPMRWENPLISKKINKYGFITIDEKIIHSFVYDTLSYSNNRVWYFNYYFLEAEKNHKKGLLDNTGRILLDFKYDRLGWINLFSNKNERDDERKLNAETFNIVTVERNRYGLLNSQLTPILPTEFDDVRIDGKIITSPIIARKNNHSIVFDSNGSYRFEVACDSLRENLKLNYFEIFKGSRQGILDYEGNVLFDFIYSGVQKTEIDNVFIIEKDSNEYLADRTGKIISEGYKEIKTIRYNWDNYAQETKDYYIITKNHNGKVGLLDQKLNKMIPDEYDSIEGIFEFKYIHAVKNGKYGILDLSNNIIIPFIYTDRINYNEGRRYFDCELDNHNFRVTPQNIILKDNSTNN